jgi:hypothetical protein
VNAIVRGHGTGGDAIASLSTGRKTGAAMTQLRRDAAYIRTKSNERGSNAKSADLTGIDDQVLAAFSTPHTVVSAAKKLGESEDHIADSMQRLLQAERIQLSPDA